MIRIMALVLVAAAASGCVSTYSQGHIDTETRTTMALQQCAQHIQQLEARLDTSEAAREDMYARIEDMQAALTAESNRVSARFDQMDGTVAAEAAQRETMKSELVDQLTKKMTELVNGLRPAATAQSGYEHTVRSGETLSAIAQAYGTTIAAIKGANKLNSDMIRVGQVLFIPE